MNKLALDIHFYLNDQYVNVTIDPELTALHLIRNHCQLTGPKESCGEGDCGSCTVALGKENAGQISYLAVNTCILPAAKLHGTHLITIEGLASREKLHFIQECIVDNHATQCGYCTPGVILSLFCLLSNSPQPTQAEITTALEGNLCRCTGYVAIHHAAQAAVEKIAKHPDQFKDLLFPAFVKTMPEKLKQLPAIKYHRVAKAEVDIT